MRVNDGIQAHFDPLQNVLREENLTSDWLTYGGFPPYTFDATLMPHELNFVSDAVDWITLEETDTVPRTITLRVKMKKGNPGEHDFVIKGGVPYTISFKSEMGGSGQVCYYYRRHSKEEPDSPFYLPGIVAETTFYNMQADQARVRALVIDHWRIGGVTDANYEIPIFKDTYKVRGK